MVHVTGKTAVFQIDVKPKVAKKRAPFALRWRRWLPLLVYLAVLCAINAVFGGSPQASVWDLADPAYLRRWLAEATLRTAAHFVLFVPVGVFVWSAVGRRSCAAGDGGKKWSLAARCAIMLLGVAAGAGVAVLATAVGLRRPPSLAVLTPPALAGGSGVWLS